MTVKVKSLIHECNFCGKVYKHESGLSRHKLKCNASIFETQNKQIQELQQLLKKTIDDNKNTIDNILPKVGTKIINNNLTVNVFLNEECKNAMNIKEFVNQLELSKDDLQYTKDNGYIKGITKIFVKNLTDMPLNFRPIHCSNLTNLDFYIKDENRWDKDGENDKINKSILDITQKQIKQLKEWEATNPNWNESDNDISSYMKTLVSLTNNTDDDESVKNLETIKKEIGNNTYIDVN